MLTNVLGALDKPSKVVSLYDKCFISKQSN